MKTLLDYCIDEDEHSLSVMGKFLLWLLLGLIVTFIGITNVFADTYNYNQFTAQLYDNYAPTLSAVTTDQTNGRWQGIIPTMTANSAGAAWGVSSNMVLLANHTYTLTAQITGTYGGRLVLSTYNRIGVGTTLANAKTSYQNNSYVNENYSRVLDDGYTIQFAFTPTTNGSYIVFPFATNYTGNNQYFYLSNYTIDDLGSGGVSESTINNSLNSQTNVLNQSITNSQNAIIQNNNDNTQAIIDSNKENFQTCYTNYFNIYNVGQVINSNGRVERKGSTDIEVESTLSGHNEVPSRTLSTLAPNLVVGETYILSFDASDVRNYIYLSSGFVWNNGDTRTITQADLDSIVYFYANTSLGTGRYKKLMIQKSDNYTTSYIPFGETCTNKLDEQTDAINGLNDSINNNDIDTSDATSFFNNFTDNTHGLSGIISAPLNAINSMLSNQCSPLTATWKNKTMSLPCGYDMWSRFSTFKEFLNIVLDGLLCYRILLKLFKLVERFKNPNDDRVEVMDL